MLVACGGATKRDDAPRDAEPARSPSNTLPARSGGAKGEACTAVCGANEDDRELPNGLLKKEADVLRVDALAASGDRAGAKRLASQLLARDPAGPRAKHLESVITESK